MIRKLFFLNYIFNSVVETQNKIRCKHRILRTKLSKLWYLNTEMQKINSKKQNSEFISYNSEFFPKITTTKNNTKIIIIIIIIYSFLSCGGNTLP